jgi:hypothetical protein
MDGRGLRNSRRGNFLMGCDLAGLGLAAGGVEAGSRVVSHRCGSESVWVCCGEVRQMGAPLGNIHDGMNMKT